MYCVSTDSQGKLIKTNQTIKNNLKTWLNNYRMINDTVDILDAYIINVGIEFVVKAISGANKSDVLASVTNTIAQKMSEGFFIGEPLYVTDIYSEVKKLQNVLDVVSVKIFNKSGGQYSFIDFDINSNMSPDGTHVVCPKNSIFELKFTESDIKGKVR